MNRIGKGKKVLAMALMLLAVALLFGAVFGYKAFQGRKMMQAMSGHQPPPVTVTAMQAKSQPWQAELKAVGTLRAVLGIDVASEIAGLVKEVHFQQGDRVPAGHALVQLDAEDEVAKLHALEATAELADIVYDRDRKQYDVQAVSRAQLDADLADLRNKRALVAQQAEIVRKNTIYSPFAGRLGISAIAPGQYLNPGDRIVSLQALDTLYCDFFLPQQDLADIRQGQEVAVAADAWPKSRFTGRITTINPKVESDSRNVQVEAQLANSEQLLLPGMYVSVTIRTGAAKRYLTLPQTAVMYHPYGNTAFVVLSGKGPDGRPVLTVREVFVTTGPTRGDQVAILAGLKEGDTVVTSGQIKLRNGSAVIINNRVSPSNDAAPKPVDQ